MTNLIWHLDLYSCDGHGDHARACEIDTRETISQDDDASDFRSSWRECCFSRESRVVNVCK